MSGFKVSSASLGERRFSRPEQALKEKTAMTRRTVLKATLLGALNCMIPYTPALAKKYRVTGVIRLHNVHTNETHAIRYLSGKRVDPKAMEKLNHLFRYRTGAIHPIDPRLIVLLDAIHTDLKLGKQPFLLLSGYRPPVKKQFSFHHKGMAADLKIKGVPVKKLRDAALAFHQGGVGTYPSWVHIDVGPFRTWRRK